VCFLQTSVSRSCQLWLLTADGHGVLCAFHVGMYYIVLSTARLMYKMDTRMLLAIVAFLTVMTSSIGVGIFLQHVNAAKLNDNGATVQKGVQCVTVNGVHGTGHSVTTPSGRINAECHI
jgi:hypothetical protein